MRVCPGEPYPLGATYDGSGTNFSLFSQAASKVELCLFSRSGQESRIELPEYTNNCWHCYLPGVSPGQRYGYRVHGTCDPTTGQKCCASKLLIDPYAKAIEGQIEWNEAMFLYYWDDPNGPPNDLDSAQFMPKSVVINPFYDWRDDHRPRITFHETVIYETNVKGFSIRKNDIPPEIRGTYAAMSHPASIDYFKRLGITAVELMPVHQFIQDKSLLDKGLRNFWGYNTIGYFAPHNEYCSSGHLGQQVQEFKRMAQCLHEAGIELILDVVYNHTAEGNHMGPVLSFKGIDNASYYRLMPDDPRHYMDYTGTGNTLNMRHPAVLQMMMDSLRYWVIDMHVDGFRFDLAATLARELHAVDRLSAFFDVIHQDPVLSQVKLIAEPWDVGEGGYQVGNFPPRWCEWNGKYRDSIRDYWRGADQSLGELANRFTGSSDLYAGGGRRPYASVNFVTAHDGFTLADMVSYDHKHNEANGEDNRDGSDDNRSWNCGHEGPTDDQGINALRARQRRNFMTTLLLSQGIPMILGGDELGRSKQGNNNSYCQDNELSWYEWEHIDQEFLDFTTMLINLRRRHPTFRRWKWLTGQARGGPVGNVGWFRPDGNRMSDENWREGFVKSLQVFLDGQNIAGLDRLGGRVVDDDFLIMFNAHWETIAFNLVCFDRPGSWRKIINTAHATCEESVHNCGDTIYVMGRSVVVLRHDKT